MDEAEQEDEEDEEDEDEDDDESDVFQTHKEEPVIVQKDKKVNDVGLEEQISPIKAPEKSAAEKKQDHYDRIIKQDLNINLLQPERQIKQHTDAKEKQLDQKGVEDLRKKLESYIKYQSKLEDRMTEKESEGWDIKFQNYWGYIVAAGDNEDQCKSMCQKLFNHVGQFREFVEQYV